MVCQHKDQLGASVKDLNPVEHKLLKQAAHGETTSLEGIDYYTERGCIFELVSDTEVETVALPRVPAKGSSDEKFEPPSETRTSSSRRNRGRRRRKNINRRY
ncbi:hypothetical protein LIER_02184 [Lithospermum erythrorhizon]|uniref:Uncharacterized protein n=1 Tax=Lithospermum erythrorhizon TaxID=34254 RepID=A0AAV3NNH1_LITER